MASDRLWREVLAAAAGAEALGEVRTEVITVTHGREDDVVIASGDSWLAVLDAEQVRAARAAAGQAPAARLHPLPPRARLPWQVWPTGVAFWLAVLAIDIGAVLGAIHAALAMRAALGR